MMVLHLLIVLHLFIHKQTSYPQFQNKMLPFSLFIRVTYMK